MPRAGTKFHFLPLSHGKTSREFRGGMHRRKLQERLASVTFRELRFFRCGIQGGEKFWKEASLD